MSWVFHRFDLVDSTNRVAAGVVRELLEKDAGAKVGRQVFVARTQMAGRGQYERTFVSPVGGLYLTAVLDGVAENLRAPLPLLVGITTVRGLGMPGVRVRWPNDLVIGERKVAGILCEGIALGGRWVALAGIGINVNSDPAELPGHATSLLAVDGRRDLEGMLGRILIELDGITRAGWDWRAEFAGIDALRGRRVAMVTDGERTEGTANGVSETGALLLECAEGMRELGRGSVMEVDGRTIRAEQN